jgi:hypothetical protein
MFSYQEPGHPGWCLGGPDCRSGVHMSRIRVADPAGREIVQVGAGLWLMEVGKVSPGGVLLELSVDEEPQRWMLSLVQSRALVPILQDLLKVADRSFPRR